MFGRLAASPLPPTLRAHDQGAVKEHSWGGGGTASESGPPPPCLSLRRQCVRMPPSTTGRTSSGRLRTHAEEELLQKCKALQQEKHVQTRGRSKKTKEELEQVLERDPAFIKFQEEVASGGKIRASTVPKLLRIVDSLVRLLRPRTRAAQRACLPCCCFCCCRSARSRRPCVRAPHSASFPRSTRWRCSNRHNGEQRILPLWSRRCGRRRYGS